MRRLTDGADLRAAFCEQVSVEECYELGATNGSELLAGRLKRMSVRFLQVGVRLW